MKCYDKKIKLDTKNQARYNVTLLAPAECQCVQSFVGAELSIIEYDIFRIFPYHLQIWNRT
jgi:hypothetical protein